MLHWPGPKEPIHYPADFTAAVKSAYPDFAELHQALDQGRLFVGRYLDDSNGLRMEPEEIVAAFTDGRQLDVLTAATMGVLRDALYRTWQSIVYPHD